VQSFPDVILIPWSKCFQFHSLKLHYNRGVHVNRLTDTENFTLIGNGTETEFGQNGGMTKTIR